MQSQLFIRQTTTKVCEQDPDAPSCHRLGPLRYPFVRGPNFPLIQATSIWIGVPDTAASKPNSAIRSPPDEDRCCTTFGAAISSVPACQCHSTGDAAKLTVRYLLRRYAAVTKGRPPQATVEPAKSCHSGPAGATLGRNLPLSSVRVFGTRACATSPQFTS